MNGLDAVLPNLATRAYCAVVTGDESAASLLRRLRREQGRSLRGVSAEIGLAASQLSRIERGERRPSNEASAKLASYYGVSPEVIELAEGFVPRDIVEILRKNPHEVDRLRARYSSDRNEGE